MNWKNNKQMLHQVQHDEGKRELKQKKRHPEDVMLSLSKYDSGSHDLEEQLADAESSSA